MRLARHLQWCPLHLPGYLEYDYVFHGDADDSLGFCPQLAEANLSPEEWEKREVKVKIMRNKKLPKVPFQIS